MKGPSLRYSAKPVFNIDSFFMFLFFVFNHLGPRLRFRAKFENVKLQMSEILSHISDHFAKRFGSLKRT